MMVPAVGWVIATRSIPFALDAAMALTVTGVLWFIWSRPARRSAQEPSAQTQHPANADPVRNQRK